MAYKGGGGAHSDQRWNESAREPQSDQRWNESGREPQSDQRWNGGGREPRPFIIFPEDMELEPMGSHQSPVQSRGDWPSEVNGRGQDFQEEWHPKGGRRRLQELSVTDPRDQVDGFTNSGASRGDVVSVVDDPDDEAKEKQQPMCHVCVNCIVRGREEEDFLASYKWCPPPISMIIISIVQIIIFIVYAVELENKGVEVTAIDGVPDYSPLIYKPERRYEAWRFITYMFIHVGYLHLVFNVFIQLALGIPLEWVQTWRIPIIYLIGVISGSLAHSLTDHKIGLAGASGGGYSLIGAHLAAITINWKEMNYKCWSGNFCRMLMSAPVRLSLVLSIALADTGLAIYKRFGQNSHQIGISAHIGGLLAGLLVGIPFLKNVKVNPCEKTAGWVTLIVYLVIVVGIIFFNGFYKGYPPTDWS